MTPPPLLVDGYASSFTYTASAGIYRMVRLPTLDEVRTRRRQPQPCTCTDGSCRRCLLREDHAFNRSQDI